MNVHSSKHTRISFSLIFFLSLLLVSSFFLTGCYESGMGIFYSLEIERKLEDYNLENNLSIGAVAKAGSNYYAAAGAVYKRVVNETQWQAIAPPGGYNLSTSLAEHGGSIYACFFDTAAANFGLFKLSGDEWTEVTDANVANAATVISVNNYLLVSNRVSSTEYSYFYSADGAAFTTTGLANKSAPITAAVWDGTNYFVAIEDVVFLDTDGGVDPPDNFSATAGTIVTSGIGGMYFAAAGSTNIGTDTLFASTEEGKVHFSTDNGGTWTEMDGGSSFPLTDIELITTSGTEEVLVAGTIGGGYLEAVISAGDNAGDLTLTAISRDSYSTDQNYLNTELSSAPINDFFYDTVEDVLFAGTSGNGLWRNSQAATYRTWNIE